MNKVTVVSLAGNAFHFEEPAHEAVSAYLARASRALSTNPDRAEILLDLEEAIADKCQRFLGKHKNVITAEEAAQVVREMGPVQGGDDEPGSSCAEWNWDWFGAGDCLFVATESIDWMGDPGGVFVVVLCNLFCDYAGGG